MNVNEGENTTPGKGIFSIDIQEPPLRQSVTMPTQPKDKMS